MMYPILRKSIALNMERVQGTTTPEKVPSVFLLSVGPGPGVRVLLEGLGGVCKAMVDP